MFQNVLLQELLSLSIFYMLGIHIPTIFLFVCLLSDIALGPMDGKSTKSLYFDVSGSLEMWKPCYILIDLWCEEDLNIFSDNVVPQKNHQLPDGSKH